MTQWTLTAALACGLGFFAAASHAADDARKDDRASGKSFTGILVDNKCGPKLPTQKFAQRHPASCLKMEECAKTGYQLVAGDKHMKFDEKGNTLAKEFIASEDFTTRVVVMGTPGDDGKTINVTSIKAVPEEKKQEEKTAKVEDDGKAEKATKQEKGEARSEKSDKPAKSAEKAKKSDEK